MRKVVFYWDWHGDVDLTIDKVYTVLESEISGYQRTEQYLIQGDSGEKRWYEKYCFEDISVVREQRLKELGV